MQLDLLLIRFLIVFLKHKLVHTHTKKRDPNGLMINEVFTFGQWRSAFTSGVPFIELSRASDEEISLDKYSILVYSVNKRPNDESLRFVMDLRWHSMAKDQKFALISDGSYAQKLTNSPLIDTFGVTFNFRYHGMNFLSIGNYQHLIVALMYNGDVPDYTINGQVCKNKCGTESLHEGQNWCYTVSGLPGTPTWDFCCPNDREDTVPGYIFDQQFLSKGGTNIIDGNLWKYIEKNTIDLVIIRGKSAAKRNKQITERHQKSVGYGVEIMYITNPDIGTSTIGSENDLFSVSNCGLSYATFQFDKWKITKPSPGNINLCVGGVTDTSFPTCKTPTTDIRLPDSFQEPEDTACMSNISNMIIDTHEKELESTFSRQLKVTGDNLVSGTYNFMDELNHASGRPVYEREFSSENDIYYIFYDNDHIGWRIGNKASLDGASGSTYYSGRHDKNPGDIKVKWTNNVNENNVFVQRSETGQIDEKSNCPKIDGLNHKQAEQNVKLEMATSRKRHFTQSALKPEQRWTEDRPWKLSKFDDEWIDIIKTHHSTRIDIEDVEMAKMWFELVLVPGSPLYQSRYRCWQCHEYSDIYDVRIQHRSALSYSEGVMHEKKMDNRRTILNHEKSIGHQQIQQRLEDSYDGTDLYDDLRYYDKPHTRITSRVMRTIYTAIKHLGGSYNSMQYLITVQEQNGLKLGRQCKSPTSHTNMAAVISDTMHERLVTSIKSSGNPLSLIVDTSTDKGNSHQLVVLFYTLENEVPVTYLYRFIKLGSDQTAEAQTNALINQLKADNLYEHIKKHIISFVSDGASVMTGIKKGMGVRLRKLFGPKLITHHCLNHRIELVFGHAMDEFDDFNQIEKNLNDLYSFYKNSGKTFGSMEEFLSDEELSHFSLNYIHKIRWVSSHHRAVKKVFDHLPEIVRHLTIISSKNDRINHNPKIVKKAKRLLRFLTDKKAILLMVYNLDAQLAFSIQSKLFEASDASIIGMSHAKTKLENDLNDVKALHAEKETQKFLSAATCGDLQANVKCETIERYEEADFVIWNGVKLQTYDSDFEKLSDVKNPYIETIQQLLNDYLPQIRVSDFDMFDQRLWNDGVDLIEANFISKMKSVIAELKFQTPRGVGLITIGREFFNLVKKIRDSAIWCTINESKPSMFWANILKDASMTMTVSLREIIRSALAIPAGSAAAERLFGMLNYIKDSSRTTLSQENTNHIIRIRHNGPRIGAINIEPYTDKYLEKFERCDPLHVSGKVSKAAKKVKKLESENVYTNIFS